MKFREERPFADVDAAVKKLLEIANGMAADHAGRLSVGILNTQFKDAGGSYPEYSAAVKAAIDRGYITMQASGGYLSFTQAGADLFAWAATPLHAMPLEYFFTCRTQLCAILLQ